MFKLRCSDGVRVKSYCPALPVGTLVGDGIVNSAEDVKHHRDEGSLHRARTNVLDECVSVLANYRAHTSARSSPGGQLILPELMQLLPLFCLSLQCVHPNLFKVSDVRTKDGEWIAPNALDRNRYAEDERCFLSRYIINNA